MTKPENNIFKVENNGKRPVILMSGYIGGYSVNADNLYRGIKQMENNEVTDCDILINCAGGSTIDGMTIGEFLEKSPINFHGIVTGMAASMAGVLLQFCNTRSSYKYGRIMTHKVQGGVRGESDQVRAYADLMDSEEENITAKFIERTGQTKETVAGWLKSGVNLWFNASKAKTANLIDTILETKKEAPKAPKNATVEELVNTYGTVFNSILEEYITEPQNEEENPIDNNMKKQILGVLGIAGMQNGLTENATDEAVLAELRNVVNAAKRATDAENELKEFKGKQAKLLVANMAKAGKITAAEIEQWEADAIENYNLVATAAERMTGKVDPNAGLNRKQTNPEDANLPAALKGREDWNHAKWMEEDPKGYEKLSISNPEAYEKIFNLQFNPED
ncbi:ATP-dependent protease ClpP [Maribacter dokdonensis]|uniref:ATP-dependent Clp protease proteolytic subunit n=1 Tax=Maribacter dokdonensis TaxID=320912 RepID=UPI001B07821E|nr:ATP-dependent Clp protease proteolytic subunit [Maribacter dokdonensis]CAG2532935.1 ATP-dependent protease ClpP [Maribacter dokdonensis]